MSRFHGKDLAKSPWSFSLIVYSFLLIQLQMDKLSRQDFVHISVHLIEEDREKLFKAKLQRIEAPGGNSWLGSLIATIIGNLRISITNVHIRYEDTVSNPGHSFSSGLTLSKLAAVTVDEEGNETFDTSGALDKLRKSLQLHRLAVYHDSDGAPWKLHKRWEDLNPGEWTEIFADGIDESHGGVSIWASERKYLVSPINGTLKYHRIGKQERNDFGVPLEKASLVLSDYQRFKDASSTIYLLFIRGAHILAETDSTFNYQAQYYDGIKLLETFSQYKTRIEVSHLRPVVSVFDDPHIWWRYLAQASLQQKKM
ncbi:hypothetical protein Taro_013085, partial [Colocasia esculenta]|nr:hypothetical protein [Colocasia esculenta]